MSEKDFIKDSVKTVQSKLKIFPDAFVDGIAVEPAQMKPVRLNLGEEFFGQYELLELSGQTYRLTSDPAEAKYLVYASREKKNELLTPHNAADYQKITVRYEKYLDEIIRDLTAAYAKKFPDGKNAAAAVGEVFRLLDLVRF